MVMINFWFLLSPEGETALKGLARVGPLQETSGPVPLPAAVSSQAFPRANVLRPDTLKLARNFPERYNSSMPAGLWNCYARGSGLHEFVGIREDLQGLQERYPSDFITAGCWNVATGEPIGGVGSPWFETPPELTDRRDIVLMAGQAPRKFI